MTVTTPRAELLEVLARADAAALKDFAETLLAPLATQEIEVLQNRTGLVMVPMQDTVEKVDFFLGEVLMAEAHIRVGRSEGYGLRQGRDLEAAMAMAVIDLALAQNRSSAEIDAFARAQGAALTAVDTAFLRGVEATRVEMETF